jgi:hypothetical protein
LNLKSGKKQILFTADFSNPEAFTRQLLTLAKVKNPRVRGRDIDLSQSREISNWFSRWDFWFQPLMFVFAIGSLIAGVYAIFDFLTPIQTATTFLVRLGISLIHTIWVALVRRSDRN